MTNITVEIPNKKFDILFNTPEDTEIIICIGGRGGSKTYEVSKSIAYKAIVQDKRIQVLRDEKESIKESILNEVLLRYDTANEFGTFDGTFERQSNGIKNVRKDSMQVFTKGFRASSLSKVANLKSVSNVDIAVIEEAEDIRDEDKFNTFADSIREKGSYIIIILNTPDINHWIIKRYFNLEAITLEDAPTLSENDIDGYFKLTPKGLPGVYVIQTSYKDNEFLPQKTVNSYESYGDPDSTKYNPHYFLTSILGFASTGLKGQIFKNYNTITLEEFNNVDAREVIGLDFGTSSPAAMVLVKIRKNEIFVHELSYVGMGVKEIGIKLCELGIGEDTLIIADSAEPDSIRRLYYGFDKYDNLSEREVSLYPQLSKGFNIIPAKKGAGSIMAGIGIMLGMQMRVTETSTNILRELVSYIYATDKNGNPLDRPIDANNHAIDAVRMVVLLKGTF